MLNTILGYLLSHLILQQLYEANNIISILQMKTQAQSIKSFIQDYATDNW
jgi:hypothetical protein